MSSKENFSLGLLSGIVAVSEFLENIPDDQREQVIKLLKQSSAEMLEAETGMPAEDIMGKIKPIVDKAMHKAIYGR